MYRFDRFESVVSVDLKVPRSTTGWGGKEQKTEVVGDSTVDVPPSRSIVSVSVCVC